MENLQNADFEAFMSDWGDFVLDVTEHDDTIDETNIEHIYYSYLPEISELGNKALFRGINVDEKWVSAFMRDEIGQTGIHWSTDQDTAVQFASTTNKYDDRFESVGSGMHIVLQARDLDQDSIDVNATIAALMANGESEVTLKKDHPVFIASILIDGHWHMIGKTLRA